MSRPDAFSIATIFSRASKRSTPRSAAGTRPAASVTSFIAPVSSITIGGGELVAQAHLEVVRIVRGRDLHHAGAERGIGVVIGDHRDREIQHRQQHGLPHERRVALVGRIHRHRHVAEHRLGARRRHDHRALRIARHRIRDVIELAVGLHAFRLFVAQRRETARAPVDHAVPLVHEAVLVQPHERLAHRARQLRTQRVRRARPVAARADRRQLLEDRLPGLRHERLGAPHERLASDVRFALALRRRAASRPRSAWRCPRGPCPAPTALHRPPCAASG